MFYGILEISTEFASNEHGFREKVSSLTMHLSNLLASSNRNLVRHGSSNVVIWQCPRIENGFWPRQCGVPTT
ncbi:hypothetical protein RchiOBHm_Chr2g0116991 [Rosa chinensis]|uniref:Uncharacterized protein n=1 Tax=Rosa chinensis TaxID=74649 RepID=A0A2P6RRE4_ROSCH|nr:hypothetical protein RchiOBHm_Chr2g0116991 [Rosa chinensis]